MTRPKLHIFVLRETWDRRKPWKLPTYPRDRKLEAVARRAIEDETDGKGVR